MTQAIGHGSKIAYGNADGPPETFTQVLGVTDIQFGSDKVDIHDNTDLGTTGNIRTKIGGLEDAGDVTVKLNYIPGDTTQAALNTKKDGLAKNWKFTDAGGTHTKVFPGVIASLDFSVPDDKIPTLTMKIAISGPVVVT